MSSPSLLSASTAPQDLPWRPLLRQARRRAREAGLLEGLRLLWAARWALGPGGRCASLFATPHFRQAVVDDPQADALFFLSHRHFLCLGLSTEARLACAVAHVAFEAGHLASPLLLALHRGPGLGLWAARRGSRLYEIRWLSSVPLRHEGPLSLVLEVDGRRLHELSFAWVDGTIFGASTGLHLLVTRHQSVRASDPALQQFRADFPQHSPSYVAFAALVGLATALGHERVLALRGDRQIAWEPALAASFRHAYDDCWHTMGGTPCGPHAFEVPVPVQMAELAQVKAKHRARARARRALWCAVFEASRSAVLPHRRS